MASYKDTFEPDVFAPRVFATGVFRGYYEAALAVPGIEYSAPNWRLHARSNDFRVHYHSLDWRIHYKGDEQ